MSVQWTLVATFLYAEIGIVILLLIPFISPKTYDKYNSIQYKTIISLNLLYLSQKDGKSSSNLDF